MGKERQPQPEWLEIGAPPSRAGRRVPRRRWLAGLAAALTAVAVAAMVEERLDHPSGQVGPYQSPATTQAPQPGRPLPGPVVLPGPTVPGADGWVVYGRGDAEVVRLELGPGRMTRTPVPELDTGGPVTFLATPSGVLVRPVRAVPGYQVPDREPAGPLPRTLGQGGLILPGPQPDQLWITSTSRYSTRGEMLLASLSSGWVRVQAGLPANTHGSVRPDGAGSYYIGATGGSYVRVPGGYRRISTGTVLAATDQSWLSAECDERLRCRHLLVDRRSGTRRQVRLLPSFYAEVTLVSLSPDSRYAAVAYRLGTQSPALHVIDLTTGADREVAARFDSGLAEGSLVWSPTGDHLAAVGGQGRLLVVRSATAEIVPLDPDPPPILQLATKPR